MEVQKGTEHRGLIKELGDRGIAHQLGNTLHPVI